MILTLLVGRALACGGLVPSIDTEQLAASDALQAIFDVGEDRVSVEYRVHYTGDAEDFAWIIPVPGEVIEVTEGVDERFDTLAELTAPLVRTYTYESSDEGGGGFGCGAGSKSDAGGLGTRNGDEGTGIGVTVVGQGYAGDYSYTVIAAEDSAGFADWLTGEGYDLTYAAGPIAEYVADPIGFMWVAVQLRPDVPTTPEGGVTLSPLQIEYGPASGDGKLHTLYPSRMGSTIQLAEVRTELYVLADGKATGGNGWVTNTDQRLSIGSDEDPVGAYADFLRAVGGSSRGLVEVWHGAYRDESGADRVLTRVDSITAPATNTLDIAFAIEAGAVEDSAFYIDAGGYYYGAAFGVLGLLGATWGLRRKRWLSPSPPCGRRWRRSTRGRTPARRAGRR